MDEQQKPTVSRGFAAMSKERQKEISRLGGRAAHRQGRAHKFTSVEAREAGQKGGLKVSLNREHMAAIGQKGGQSRGRQRALLRSLESRQSVVADFHPVAGEFIKERG